MCIPASGASRIADDGLGRQGKSISVHGVVQGVGFRPFVYRLAHQHGVTGWVLNHSGGVDIEIEGKPSSVERFLRDLEEKAPPLARISHIEVQDRPVDGYLGFEIRESRQQAGHYQLISPDIATCPDCLREILDPNDRRYRYPFTNCTNCGPRFTIITDIPYDRPNTTMGQFQMCPDCRREYDDPLDRRFHAQPNACPVCGPRLWLVQDSQARLPGPQTESMLGDPRVFGKDAISQAAKLLLEGAIVALKGVGGFHLACDATNPEVVALLRERKKRPHKPLAVMAATLEEIRRHCHVSEAGEALLGSRECPIVLLPWLEESGVARNVAPRYRHLGMMLPYTPLHHILLRDAGGPLVMTSGNLSEEPICQTNEEALTRLAHIADAFLLHDRDIYARYDDSVWSVLSVPQDTRIPPSGGLASEPSPYGRTHPEAEGPSGARREHIVAQPLRRSRGYAPYPVTLPFESRPTLAVGTELKNTFCLTRDRYGFLSQHIGDMENLETLEHFEISLRLLQHLFRIEPEIVAHDMHPEYLLTKYALAHWGPTTGSTSCHRARAILPVQHHHAHLASCLVDNGWRPDDGPVIGIIWDGTGYGTDGRIWGGEWLVGGYQGVQRAAHLEYLPLPGGDAAVRNPYRTAAGYLMALGLPVRSSPLRSLLSGAEMTLVAQQIERGVNSPLTSAAGRLFDAASALLGICPRITYEAQAAIEMEQIASRESHGTSYPWGISREGGPLVVRLGPLLEALLAELEDHGTPVSEISARFHHTMATLAVEICCHLREDSGLGTVALSGGCFQNQLLLGQTVAGLREKGFRVLLHGQVPTNDGGVSLGQAAVANMRCSKDV